MRSDFIKFFTALFPLIGMMATVQHMVVMDIPFTPRFYIVPLFVSLAIAFLAAKVRDLTRKAEAEKWQAALADSKRLSTLGLLSSQVASELSVVFEGIRLGIQSSGTAQPRDGSETRAYADLERGEALISELFQYSSVSDQRTEAVELDSLLADVQNAANDLSTGRVEIVCHHQSVPAMVAMINRSQVYHVLINMIVNAFKATADVDGGGIALMLESADGFGHISVEDNGSGVPETLAGSLFKRPASLGTRLSGGVTLYISHQIIESFGGTMSYEPGRSGGARFTVSLPLV